MVGGGSVWWYRSGGLRGMDTSHLFTAALQLQSPWKVESVDFRDAGDGRQEPHIAIGFEVGSRFCCPVHGVRTVPVPWARPGGGFTLLFEAWAAEMASLSKKSGDAAPTSTHHRTGLLQRQARGVRQQDQGHHPHGLRLPPRHQPHRPDHAPMQRTRHPTTTTHNLTHKNSRSLSSIQLFVRPPQGSNQALQKARHRFREESAARFHKGTQSQDHTHKSIPISTRM